MDYLHLFEPSVKELHPGQPLHSHSRPKGARAKAATPLLVKLETHPYNS